MRLRGCFLRGKQAGPRSHTETWGHSGANRGLFWLPSVAAHAIRIRSRGDIEADTLEPLDTLGKETNKLTVDILVQ